MTVERIEHVGIVVDDLRAAVDFFLALGLEMDGETSVEGELVDRITGLDGARSDLAFLKVPGDKGTLEIVQYRSPARPEDPPPRAADTPGLNHLLFAVDDLEATLARLRPHGAELVGEVIDYGTSYRLCYLRGPGGMIVELAEKLS
jgi:catechol 2,3-dioxygenase-like lactoylglutathione lyase family enzyme